MHSVSVSQITVHLFARSRERRSGPDPNEAAQQAQQAALAALQQQQLQKQLLAQQQLLQQQVASGGISSAHGVVHRFLFTEAIKLQFAPSVLQVAAMSNRPDIYCGQRS